MILWTFKLLSTAKKAIAGRKHPHQLAWAVAFGLLLGIVPHGNLLAVGCVVIVLSLKLNHAMAGLTALGTSFLMATRLDPYSHLVGQYVLTHPRFSPLAGEAWQLPLVPWTDLNNTVVMGSFVIGVLALVPTFVISYPIFRQFAPAAQPLADRSDQAVTTTRRAGAGAGAASSDRIDQSTHRVVMIDRGHASVEAPHTDEPIEFTEVSSASGNESQAESEPENRVAVETRIDVIRMKDGNGSQSPRPTSDPTLSQDPPMDEALNYLLRQLRDSQQRSAA